MIGDEDLDRGVLSGHPSLADEQIVRGAVEACRIQVELGVLVVEDDQAAAFLDVLQESGEPRTRLVSTQGSDIDNDGVQSIGIENGKYAGRIELLQP